jgi:NADH:ubiquinone oxidoreductase subunit F (NADH-binding)
MREHWLLPESPYASYREYLAAAGGALDRARSLQPKQIVDELKRSGLRGRGGAGFPTGVKWASIESSSCRIRYAVCNAAEGEPGTFKDRWLLRQNPYAVIEGLVIAAQVVNAKKAYLALKASFTVEIDRLQRALEEMAPVLDGVPIELVEGPEEYLYGEEKALLNVIEGIGPLPREAHSPPYEIGLFARPGSPNPALVNNAETLAHVSTIVRAGAASFRELGTPDTPGTVLYTISGDVQRPGVYECEPSVTVAELLDRFGGGPRPGRKFRAALFGVSAGVLTADKLDTPADFGSLQLAGSGLGSAGLIAFDDQASMPRVLQAVARFLYVESCNQCSACKTGLRIASSAIDELFDPKLATADDPERALTGAIHAPQGNRCYLPVQGSILIPNLLSKFRADVDAQIAHPEAAAPEYTIPKMVGFDAEARRFVYDSHQPRKRPDWTYAEPPAHAPSAPAKKPRGALAVRLAPDLHDALHAIADQAGIDLDRQVDRALREWLAERPR